MNAPDPDKPLIIDERILVQFNVHDVGVAGIAPLVLLSQRLIAYMDQRHPSSNWRIQVYKELADDVIGHTHEGTGSTAEKEVGEGMSVAAKLLKIRNVE